MSATDRRRQAGLPKKNRGSAGRVNGGLSGRPDPTYEFVGLAEFGRACDRMLAEHVPGYRVRNFSGADVTEEMVARAPKKRGAGEPRPVTRMFWKSRAAEAVWV